MNSHGQCHGLQPLISDAQVECLQIKVLIPLILQGFCISLRILKLQKAIAYLQLTHLLSDSRDDLRVDLCHFILK